jgi:hypothetical protein
MERIDDLDVASLEITDISGRHSGSSDAGDGGDLAIGFHDRLPCRPTARGDGRVSLRCGAVEGQDAAREILSVGPRTS